ncbi:pentapeptide repeat-containing protein [Saccharopolyspora cebuensis]|uniref:Pentapeptide repeat-containing protein n=1 Tax=Saccharopolyspora cebuensis TaxID=418759 RepID=A0ABV4CQL8_9PSEU
MGDRRVGLVLTIVLAVLALVGISAALLLLDPRATGADALRTGGLAAGSIVALYALWLNDRRRRTEEQRHALEHDRVADERFARAVELLGSEADQVRVGALHALAGLARTNPAYTRTVIDVLCSYLRRPFLHPRYGDDPLQAADGEPEWSQRERHEADRKLGIRLTAQRLITDLLPAADDDAAPAYDLDLTGAALEYFDLSDRKIGSVVLRHALLRSSNNFSRCAFLGPVWLTGATIGSGRLSGRVRCEDAVFHGRAWFSGVDFSGPASFDRTLFAGEVKFARSRFGDRITFRDAEFTGPADLRAIDFAEDPDFAGTTWAQPPRTDAPLPGL